MKGIAVTVLTDRPMLSEYEVYCDQLWHTRRVAVERVMGSERNSVDLAVENSGVWYSLGEELPA